MSFVSLTPACRDPPNVPKAKQTKATFREFIGAYRGQYNEGYTRDAGGRGGTIKRCVVRLPTHPLLSPTHLRHKTRLAGIENINSHFSSMIKHFTIKVLFIDFYHTFYTAHFLSRVREPVTRERAWCAEGGSTQPCQDRTCCCCRVLAVHLSICSNTASPAWPDTL